MGRKFDIPDFYRSPTISVVKNARKLSDQRKKDFSPSVIDLGNVRFKIARHFGFCYGVENAIEVAYRALNENPNKRIFLLSEMIHNPQVNSDLASRGINFIMRTDGTLLFPFEDLRSEDIVIIPAFGTQIEVMQKLAEQGVNPQKYNATCPFVEKVWKKAKLIGDGGYTVIIHGKYNHEETRATFSHARQASASVVIRDMQEAQLLAEYIRGQKPADKFFEDFAAKYSQGFAPSQHLSRIGVVNQTTMLASETEAISAYLRDVMIALYGAEQIDQHFADTRDTLCYATLDNQQAVQGLVKSGADLALVVGGYNSSNTSHLVEILSETMPTYYIKDASQIIDSQQIKHFDLHKHVETESLSWLPIKRPLEIAITAGASCPDSIVDRVLDKMLNILGIQERLAPAIEKFNSSLPILEVN